jgi:hypothetical protein
MKLRPSYKATTEGKLMRWKGYVLGFRMEVMREWNLQQRLDHLSMHVISCLWKGLSVGSVILGFLICLLSENTVWNLLNEYTPCWETVRRSLSHRTQQKQHATIVLHYSSMGLLKFGYLGKWSPCVCESLKTKEETITLNTLLYVLISLWLEI